MTREQMFQNTIDELRHELNALREHVDEVLELGCLSSAQTSLFVLNAREKFVRLENEISETAANLPEDEIIKAQKLELTCVRIALLLLDSAQKTRQMSGVVSQPRYEQAEAEKQQSREAHYFLEANQHAGKSVVTV